jgi:HlyD family secretion protein
LSASENHPLVKLEEAVVAKKRGAKRIIPIVVVAVVLVAALVYSFERRKPKEMVLSGSLEARTVQVGSLYGGRVRQVFVDEGSHVTPGQTIATLETDTIDRQIAEQQAAIAAAEAQLAKAIAGPRAEEIAQAAIVAENDERERVRYAALYRDGIVAKEQYDAKSTQARTSAEQLRLLEKGTRPEDIQIQRAQLEQQKARLASLMKQREETTVTSSVNGVVQSFSIRPGDLLAPNQPVAEILEGDQLWVRVYVPETLLGLIKVGAPARVYVDTYPNRLFSGHIGQVSSRGEYTPRNVQTEQQRAEQVFGVKVLIDRDPALKAGMAATVDLGVEAKKP